MPSPRLSSVHRAVRIGWRVVLVIGLNLLLVPPFLPIGYLAYLHDQGRIRAAWAKPWRNRLQRWWARGLLRILHLHAEVQGDPPRTPFFLVSNHLSYVDILLYLSLLRCVFVSKAEVADWPVMGWMARAAGTVFVDRASRRDVPRVNALMEEALARGDSVVLFPEGTTSDGAKLLPFKSALLAPVVGTGQAVAYAVLTYRTPPGALPASEAVCWWGGTTLGEHLPKLLGLPSIQATVTFGSYTPPPEADRKDLATDLRVRIDERFVPTAPPRVASVESP